MRTLSSALAFGIVFYGSVHAQAEPPGTASENDFSLQEVVDPWAPRKAQVFDQGGARMAPMLSTREIIDPWAGRSAAAFSLRWQEIIDPWANRPVRALPSSGL